MDPVFKPVADADVPQMLAFMRVYYALDHLAFDEARAGAALRALLDDATRGRAWLIHEGADVVGYVVLAFGFSLEFHGRDAFVDELFVVEGRRGHGVGTSALEFLVATCKTLGVRALHLEVERANVRAQTLYRKRGFVDHDRYLMTQRFSAT